MILFKDLVFIMVWVIVIFVLLLPATLILWVITPLTGILIVLLVVLWLLFIPNEEVEEDTSSGN